LQSWIGGTSNQIITADDGDGSITLSLPQSIHSGASPTFAGLTLSGLSDGQILFPTSGVLSGSSSLFWDNANTFLTSTSTAGKQLRLAYDSTHYVDFTLTTGSGGFNQFFTITPKTAALPNAFCSWHMQGSDFCFSYEGDEVNGNGVPNVTIRGPGSSGYAASSGPGLNLYNNLSAANSKIWTMYLNDSTLTFQVANDANNVTTNWLEVARSGTTISSVLFTQRLDLANAKGLSWKDSGGTLRGVLNLFSDNHLYFDNAAGGNHIFRGGGAGSTTTLLTLTTAGTLQLENACSLNWKDSGGTTRSVLLLYSDNNIYFDNSAGGDIVFRTSTTVERMRIATGGAITLANVSTGFFGASAVAQPSSTGETTGWTSGGGSAATSTDTYTGNSGTKAYTLNDVVKHLKALGLLKTS
jgi:hypothetical protein